jgi:hypothetical protein
MLGGIALLLLSAAMLLAFMAGGIAIQSAPVRLAAFAICCLLPGAGGVHLIRQYLSRPRARRP